MPEFHIARGAEEGVSLNRLAQMIHSANVAAGWWSDEKLENCLPTTGNSPFWKGRGGLKHTLTLKYVIPTKLALVHSEVSEALEGFRKSLNDDHLPDRPMIEVELADAIIRILDIAGALDLDVGGALIEKFNYNQTRADHKPENRNAPGGKSV